MFKKLWRALLSMFACSKEERWERLDRLAETSPVKFTREIAKLSPEDRDAYLQCEMSIDHPVERTLRHVPQVEPVEAEAGYTWKPGQEHSEPVQPTSRRVRPGVFERQAMNRRQRRKADAVARRSNKAKL